MEVTEMTRTKRRSIRAAGVVVSYVAGLVALTVALVALANWTDDADAALWTVLIGAVIMSLAAGYSVRGFWILGVPAAISATLMAFAILLLSSGFPSYDNDPMLGLYALVLPFVAFLVLGAPMSIGVVLGRRDEQADRQIDADG
jgi:peptidoglycan/LPS O-acetylase OafA/YrhL